MKKWMENRIDVEQNKRIDSNGLYNFGMSEQEYQRRCELMERELFENAARTEWEMRRFD